MRISIPSIPETASARRHAAHSFETAVSLLSGLLQKYRGRALVMTGAGVSVDSGIAPYRGADGHYTVHKTYRPIFYHEFIDESEKGHLARQRYWSRSFLGYPPVLRAFPNKTHYSMAALQRLGYFHNIITQNVDSLHHAATPSPALAANTILELHGTLKNVVCVASPPLWHESETHVDRALYERLTLSHHKKDSPRRPPEPVPENTPAGKNAYPRGCGFRGSRAMYQEELANNNPLWNQMAHDMLKYGTEPKTNPDGDVELGNNVDYTTFQYSSCPQCGGILKPAVIFFGESVPNLMRDRSFDLVDQNDALILIGTSLATYSAFRLVKAAHEQGKQTLLVNLGPTRADNIVDDKIDMGSSEILHTVASKLASNQILKGDHVLRRLMESGETISPKQSRGVVSS